MQHWETPGFMRLWVLCESSEIMKNSTLCCIAALSNVSTLCLESFLRLPIGGTL